MFFSLANPNISLNYISKFYANSKYLLFRKKKDFIWRLEIKNSIVLHPELTLLYSMIYN